MIQAQSRNRLSQDDFKFIADALCREGEEESTIMNLLTDPEMRDAILDHPKLLVYLLQHDQTTHISPSLYFYLLVRQTLMQHNIEDRSVADYLASMLVEFGKSGRAHRVNDHSTKEYFYLVDIMSDIVESSSEETFYLRSHLGNFALFVTGIFPDYIYHRAKYHPPSPGFRYFEQVGSDNYHIASRHSVAERYQLSEILATLARHFVQIRRLLNYIADNYLHLDQNAGATDRVARRVDQFIKEKKSN